MVCEVQGQNATVVKPVTKSFRSNRWYTSVSPEQLLPLKIVVNCMKLTVILLSLTANA